MKIKKKTSPLGFKPQLTLTLVHKMQHNSVNWYQLTNLVLKLKMS